MKEAVFKNPNKMEIQSGHKTFDRQSNLISYGNCISNTQISFYIRSYEQTNSNGVERKKGELQQYDLKHFKNLPYYIKQAVKKYAQNQSVILYHFFIEPVPIILLLMGTSLQM